MLVRCSSCCISFRVFDKALFCSVRRSSTIVNDIEYEHPSLERPIIAISLDGCGIRHIEQAYKTGHMKHLQSILQNNAMQSTGIMESMTSVFPTTTRVNHVSITTGTNVDQHGIIGQYAISVENNKNEKEIIIKDTTDCDSLFSDSILSEMSFDQIPILILTIDNELHDQIAYDLHHESVCISLIDILFYKELNETNAIPKNRKQELLESVLNFVECNKEMKCKLNEFRSYFIQGTNERNIIFNNDDDGQCSLFLLEIVKQLISTQNTFLLTYIALTPATLHYYHSYSDDKMYEYLEKIDGYLQFYHENGFRYGITSGHSTNYKLGNDNRVKIVNIQQAMDECWKQFANEKKDEFSELKINNIQFGICLQSSALDVIFDDKCTGNLLLFGFAQVFIFCDCEELHKIFTLYSLHYLRQLSGIYSSIGKEDACLSLQLPMERTGDIVLLANIDAVFGEKSEYECKWQLSHGCLDESTVPFIANEMPTDAYRQMLSKGKGRNFHLFDILLNGYNSDLQQRCPYKYIPSEYQYIGKEE